jgi:hypothetical protein
MSARPRRPYSSLPSPPTPQAVSTMNQRPPRKRKPRRQVKYLLAGGSMLAIVGVLVDLKNVFQPPPDPNVCQEVVQAQSVLSRDELSRLLNVPERDNKSAVREIVSEPYCTLPDVEIREGVTAEREAYPLAFDPQTWFVVLYEGEEYAGYSFVFQQ